MTSGAAEEMSFLADLLTSGIQHLNRSGGLFGSSCAGLAGLFLGNKVSRHVAKLGHSLFLAAAGAQGHSRNNGEDESGEFHKTEYG